MGNPEYMTTEEAAAYLDYSVSWMKKNRLSSNKGHKVKIVEMSKCRVRYKKSDLDLFLDEKHRGYEQMGMFSG